MKITDYSLKVPCIRAIWIVALLLLSCLTMIRSADDVVLAEGDGLPISSVEDENDQEIIQSRTFRPLSLYELHRLPFAVRSLDLTKLVGEIPSTDLSRFTLHSITLSGTQFSEEVASSIKTAASRNEQPLTELNVVWVGMRLGASGFLSFLGECVNVKSLSLTNLPAPMLELLGRNSEALSKFDSLRISARQTPKTERHFYVDAELTLTPRHFAFQSRKTLDLENIRFMRMADNEPPVTCSIANLALRNCEQWEHLMLACDASLKELTIGGATLGIHEGRSRDFVTGHSITSAQIASVRSRSSLVSITMHLELQNGTALLRELARGPNLKLFHAEGVKDCDLSVLVDSDQQPRAPNLVSLTLRGNIIKNVSALTHLPSLRYLRLEASPSQFHAFEPMRSSDFRTLVSRLSHLYLREFNLKTTLVDEDVESEKPRSLKHLWVLDCSLCTQTWKSLQWAGGGLSKLDLAYLSRNGGAKGSILPEGAIALGKSAISSLSRLDVHSDSAVSDVAEMIGESSLSMLQSLRIAGKRNSLSGNAAQWQRVQKAIQEAPKLEELSLAYLTFDEAALDLGKFKSLAGRFSLLYVNSCTGAKLSDFVRLARPNLASTLYFESTEDITAEEIEHLSKIKFAEYITIDLPYTGETMRRVNAIVAASSPGSNRRLRNSRN